MNANAAYSSARAAAVAMSFAAGEWARIGAPQATELKQALVGLHPNDPGLADKMRALAPRVSSWASAADQQRRASIASKGQAASERITSVAGKLGEAAAILRSLVEQYTRPTATAAAKAKTWTGPAKPKPKPAPAPRPRAPTGPLPAMAVLAPAGAPAIVQPESPVAPPREGAIAYLYSAWEGLGTAGQWVVGAIVAGVVGKVAADFLTPPSPARIVGTYPPNPRPRRPTRARSRTRSRTRRY